MEKQLSVQQALEVIKIALEDFYELSAQEIELIHHFRMATKEAQTMLSVSAKAVAEQSTKPSTMIAEKLTLANRKSGR